MNQLQVVGVTTATGASHRTGGFPVAPLSPAAANLPLWRQPLRHSDGSFQGATREEYAVYQRAMQRTAARAASFDDRFASRRETGQLTYGRRPPVAVFWRMARTVTGRPDMQAVENKIMQQCWGTDVLLLSPQDEDTDRPLIRGLQSIGIQPVLLTHRDRSALLRLWPADPTVPAATRADIDAGLTAMLTSYELAGCRTALLPQPGLIDWNRPPVVRMGFVDAIAWPLPRLGAFTPV